MERREDAASAVQRAGAARREAMRVEAELKLERWCERHGNCDEVFAVRVAADVKPGPTEDDSPSVGEIEIVSSEPEGVTCLDKKEEAIAAEQLVEAWALLVWRDRRAA